MAKSVVQQIQGVLKVKTDGIWGPKSQDALNAEIEKTAASNPVLAQIQKLLGINPTGVWTKNRRRRLTPC